MSKDLFLMMREQEFITNNFLPTKKEIQKSSKDFAKNIVDSGEHNIEEVYATALRLKESLFSIESELKKSLGDQGFEAFGLKGTFVNGGNKLNLTEDEIYNELKKDLDERVKLLKLAQTQNVLDNYGNEVPKVGTTPIKSSLKVTF